jgi:prolyl-tRNA synthetase
MKGVPIRIAIGARDIEKNVVEVARRDTKEKTMVNIDGLANTMHVLLTEIQQNLYTRAEKFREQSIRVHSTPFASEPGSSAFPVARRRTGYALAILVHKVIVRWPTAAKSDVRV